MVIRNRLAKEDELRLLRAEAEEMRKARDEFRLKLRKKEWECESRMMERDQQRATVEKLRLKINRKASELNESWNREQELQERLGGAEQQVGLLMLANTHAKLKLSLSFDSNIISL